MEFSTEIGPKMGCVIRGKAPATSISYHESGSHLFVASEQDSTLRIIDCLNGGQPTDRPPMIKVTNEGIRNVRATHHRHCVLLSPGTQKKNSLYYLSVHENKILREFSGHTGIITGISLSPVDDTFLSSSNDGTVRLWNAGNSGNALGEMKMPQNMEGSPLASFDSTGLVFGITAAMSGGELRKIQLFDARNYTVGPFSELEVSRQEVEKKIRATGCNPERSYSLSKSEWISLEFNKSGKQILIGASGVSITVDGYDGTVLHSFLDEIGNDAAIPNRIATCFTSDDGTILCGNENGSISCYNVNTGLLLKKLMGHVDRVSCIASNPKYAQFATACINTAVWIW